MSQTIVDGNKAYGSEESPAGETRATLADQVSSPQIERQSLPIGRWSFGAAIWRTIPTVAVVAALAGLGYWGHHSGWKMPKFSALNGAAATPRDDWCAEHCVPESQCVECDADKFPKPAERSWCEEHGVHLCPFDHAEIAQVKETPQASGRREPADQGADAPRSPGQTPPDLRPSHLFCAADLARATRALELKPRPENNQACTSYRSRIQFASHEAVLKAGIDVEPVSRGSIVEAVTVAGEVRYDATRVAQLSARAAGSVWRVDKQVGDSVRPGEVLALVDAAEVGRLKGELLSALAEQNLRESIVRRTGGLSDKGVIPSKQVQEAETELTKAKTRVLSAQQGLINLGLPVAVEKLRGLPEDELAARIRLAGLPDSVVDALDATTTTSNLIAVTSRQAGVVVSREVVADQVVDTAKVLFKVADTSRVWLFLSVPFEEAAYVRIGQHVKFQPDGSSEQITGVVAWVSTEVDARTRTVQVRADLDNSTGRLRAETFGMGRIILREEADAIVVPGSAIQWDGSCHVVFVRDKNYFDDGAPKLFHTRSVRVGVKGEGMTEIIAGLLPREVVASVGSGVLRAQLLKNNIGAG